MWHAWERGETCTGFWWESPKEKDHLEDRGVDGRVGSKWTLERLAGVWGVEWIHLAQDRDRLAGCCECGNEPSGSGATELVRSWGIFCPAVQLLES
jgi:hypothetical protein